MNLMVRVACSVLVVMEGPHTTSIGTRAAVTSTEERGVVATIMTSTGIHRMNTARASVTAWGTSVMAMSMTLITGNVRYGGAEFSMCSMYMDWIATSSAELSGGRCQV